MMPGKVNPVICESVTQVSAQVIGHDAAAQLAEECLSTGRSVRELYLERERVTPKELERLFDPHSQRQPRA
jgi:aspartate ammonia-lyase